MKHSLLALGFAAAILLPHPVEAELVLDHVESYAKFGQRYYDHTMQPDSTDVSMCGGEDYKSIESVSVRAALESELGVLQSAAPGRKLLLRVYLTEYVCGQNGRARNIAAPLLIYSKRTTELKSTAVAFVEIVDPKSRALLKSFIVRAEGKGVASEHTAYIFSVSKDSTTVSGSALIQTLMHEVAAKAAEHAVAL